MHPMGAILRSPSSGYFDRFQLPELFVDVSAKLDGQFGRVDGAVGEPLEPRRKFDVADAHSVSEKVLGGELKWTFNC